MLTPKQENFVRYWFEGYSQREAYLKAGYSSNQLPATIDRQAFDIAHKPKVLARYEELQRRADSKSISTVEERKKILTQIQRATIGEFVDEFGNLSIQSKDKLTSSAVAEIRTERTMSGYRTTLKLRDPVGAIAEHNKMDKIYSEGSTVNIDNRVLNIYVKDNETKELIEKAGDRTVKLIVD